MTFKEWLKLQETIDQKSKRLQLGRNDRKPEWAPRREIMGMRKK